MRRVAGLLAVGGMLVVAMAGCTTTTTINGVVVPDADLTAGRHEAEPRRRAEIRVQLAANYLQNGQTAVALEEARKAVAIDPDFALGQALLGLIYLEMGARQEAEASFAVALRLDPTDPEIENNYGWLLCRTGRERESIAYFERAASRRAYRTPAMALQNAGLCMLRIKDTVAAETYLRRSFQLDASNPVTKYELARLSLAKKQIEQANFFYGLLDVDQNKSAPVLWLGVRIAYANADVRLQRQRAAELQQRFPNSLEAAALSRGHFDE